MPSVPLPSDSPPWHTLPPEQVLLRLDSAASGLAPAAVAERRRQYGANELTAAEGVNPWRILFEQFKNLLIIILLVATGLSAFLGHTIEAAAIIAIVLFAVLLGFVQEYRAGNALQALRRMAAPTARVLRGGIESTLPARELVRGDIVLLQAGDRVAADLRLLEAVNLRIDEASLTGESQPVEKQTAALADPELAVADRSNLAFAGTNVGYGRGRGVVTATGMATEFGRISGLLQGLAAERTPLQENLDRVGRHLAIAAGMVVAVIALLGWLRGAPLLEMLIFGIALAVAVVPEALPAVVTISLAIGMQRLLACHALANHLATVETLGSTAIICSDKTGTLTCNQMTVRRIWTAAGQVKLAGEGYRPEGAVAAEAGDLPAGALRRLLSAAVLASDAGLVEEDGEWTVRGDPTEGALLVAAAKVGLDPQVLNNERPRIGEIPFSSESKFMLTLHRVGDGTLACAKGAPEVILGRCSHLLSAAGEAPLDDAARREILAAAEKMAGQALRVMAVAEGRDVSLAEAEGRLTFLGLAGMIDPPRPEAYVAIRTCVAAGITPVMITGDHPQTARAIARELGILKEGEVLTGPELEKLSTSGAGRPGGDGGGLCPGLAGAQAAGHRGLAEQGEDRRHDRRRRQRRAGAETGRHRHRHGDHRHRRQQAGRRHDPHRR